MRLLWDFTRTARASEYSGIHRLSRCLLVELQKLLGKDQVWPVIWQKGGWRHWPMALWQNRKVSPGAHDIVVTPYLVTERERPGWTHFLRENAGVKVAIFHDAIPLRFPEITWPASVHRHPLYMKELGLYDRILAVSEESREDLLNYWRWLGLAAKPVEVFRSGADADHSPRQAPEQWREEATAVLAVGILEPRKNQELLLAACQRCWEEGLSFPLHLVGRVNPHFGKGIRDRLQKLRRRGFSVRHHPHLSDAGLRALYRQCRCSVFVSRAEGNGLPVLESLWHGVPVICSNVPAARWIGEGNGVVCLPALGEEELARAIASLQQDRCRYEQLQYNLAATSLPTWADAAREIAGYLGLGGSA